jgi:hypothetical protein
MKYNVQFYLLNTIGKINILQNVKMFKISLIF